MNAYAAHPHAHSFWSHATDAVKTIVVDSHEKVLVRLCGSDDKPKRAAARGSLAPRSVSLSEPIRRSHLLRGGDAKARAHRRRVGVRGQDFGPSTRKWICKCTMKLPRCAGGSDRQGFRSVQGCRRRQMPYAYARQELQKQSQQSPAKETEKARLPTDSRLHNSMRPSLVNGILTIPECRSDHHGSCTITAWSCLSLCHPRASLSSKSCSPGRAISQSSRNFALLVALALLNAVMIPSS